MSGGEILVVNAGSTSLKLHLVDEREHSRQLDERQLAQLAGAPEPERGAAGISTRTAPGSPQAPPLAVAHRVVHGGARFRDPVLIDERVLERIFELQQLAPLHNAPALRGIERTQALFGDLPQVAVFDTAFHRTLLPEASVYALPHRFREQWGVRRYGFHGLSVQWSAERAAGLLGLPVEELRLVVCHLGGGCSVSAVHEGRSLDTTMGFSPLEGVPMGTRSGSVDPGALTYLLRERKLSVRALEHALNFDSGLRGLGGAGGDMLEIERAAAAGNPDAHLAIEVLAHRVAGAVAAMGVATRGIDTLVFTAGMGERSALVRERICARLGFLGIRLDPARNGTTHTGGRWSAAAAGHREDRANDPPAPQKAVSDRVISAAGSSVRVLVIGAREEIIAARAARSLLVGRLKKDRPAGGSGPIRGRE